MIPTFISIYMRQPMCCHDSPALISLSVRIGLIRSRQILSPYSWILDVGRAEWAPDTRCLQNPCQLRGPLLQLTSIYHYPPNTEVWNAISYYWHWQHAILLLPYSLSLILSWGRRHLHKDIFIKSHTLHQDTCILSFILWAEDHLSTSSLVRYVSVSNVALGARHAMINCATQA